MVKEILTFKPKQITAVLFDGLSRRSEDIIRKRFGLDQAKPMTLEAVGQIYGITRERVRQIEDFTLRAIKKSEVMVKISGALDELRRAAEEYGGVVHEQGFLTHLTADPVVQNHIHFLLVLGDAFHKLKEDDDLHHRWTINPNLATAVHQSLKNLCRRLSTDDLLSQEEIVKTFVEGLHESLHPEHAESHAPRWITLSKEIGCGPTGEWGLTASSNVRVRGIRDYAYLVLRRHKEPMHFNEVARVIKQEFGKTANPATCHNELIKDSRFVLVGRGIYALAEWGYQPGVVRDVIRRVLKQNGPLPLQEVLTLVLKERQVKPNTVLVNLKNPRYFKQDKNGSFVAVG